MRKIILLGLFSCLTLLAHAGSVEVVEARGWMESAYVKFMLVDGAKNYNVYVKGGQYADYTKIDAQLVRNYGTYGRADAVGLQAGTYAMKIVPVSAEGTEMTAQENTVSDLEVRNYPREGFAFINGCPAPGAYNSDGTLKAGAKVFYVTKNTAKTITTTVKTGSKDSNITTCTGIQTIIDAYQKGYDTTPVAFRFIGLITVDDLDHISSSAEGLQVKGKKADSELNMTFEGIGDDATLYGFGFLVRNAKSVEFRNFAIMLCKDDCLSLDSYNANIWIHNMDFFYGNTGGDADQAKGDGTVDIKGKSKNITVSYNHFIDCGKTSLGGMKSEDTSCWMTYHHNWFDHSDSRHPRIRTAFYHVYNNYFDGVSKYGVGVTTGGSSFVEANYFRNCKYPMLISKQGTDAEGDGTFSGEDGGVIKAFNNKIDNPRKVQYYTEGQTDGAWDAVKVDDRSASVAATAFSGGTAYNNEADLKARTTYVENKMDAPEDVKAIVKGQYGAGRLQHGDFKWSFNNSLQDENYGVISELKSALQNYKSTLVGFFDGTTISNGGATETVDGGDGKGISEEENDSYVPSWAGGSGGGGGGSTTTDGQYVIGTSSDYFWFNADNEAQYNAYVAAGTFTTTGTANPTYEVKKSDGTSCSDYVGSIRLAPNQYFLVYHADGICTANFYVSGNGSQKWKLETSVDGTTWTTTGTVEGKAATHPACNITTTGENKYVRITNTASGNRDLQGIKIATPAGGEASIQQVTNSQWSIVNSQLYDLQGRKVIHPTRGIYILHGKKVVLKKFMNFFSAIMYV